EIGVLEVLGVVVEVVAEVEAEPLPMRLEAAAEAPELGVGGQRRQLAAGVLVVVERAEVLLDVAGELQLQVGSREPRPGAERPSRALLLGGGRPCREQQDERVETPSLKHPLAHGSGV